MPTIRVLVRLLAARERAILAPLLEELLHHYRMPPATPEAIRRAVDDEPPGVEMLAAFAEDDDAPVGFASFAQIFPGLAIAPQIYMKELYVAAAARGQGVGEALLRALAALAAERGCTRVDWTTQIDNVGACAFYERIGARAVKEKVYYRLDEAGIAALSRSAG